MIKFNRVFKIYEENIKALDDVSFGVKPGEFLFITGPSGAGKSTVLRLLYREEVPDMGTIMVNDTDISHIAGRKVPFYRREIGFVFQDFKLLFDRSVYENIALPLIITKANKEYIAKAVPEMIKRIGLTGREHLTPWHISGGEKQKVAIARAMMLAPPLFIADEPTGNLDDYSTWEIMEIFTEMNRKGTTIILATHDREILRKLKGRVLKLDKGRVAGDEMG